jgi:hypothetical protein
VGATGATGARGATGETGATGATGPAGSANVGVFSFNGPVGTVGVGGGPFVFVGPTNNVTLTAGQNVTVTLSATWATSAGASTARFDVCFQPGGGAVTEFAPAGYLFVDVTTNRLAYTVAGTRSFTAGSYTIGYCAVNAGSAALVGDWLQGSMLVT